jgi:hypothetical protein
VLEAVACVAGDDYLCADGQPSDDYLNRIVSGAEHHGLSAEHIDDIRRLARRRQATER